MSSIPVGRALVTIVQHNQQVLDLFLCILTTNLFHHQLGVTAGGRATGQLQKTTAGTIVCRAYYVQPL